MPYYSSDGEQCINGMKIIPLNIAELKNIIANSMTYDNYTRYSSALTKTMSLPKHGMKTTLCALYNRRKPPQGY